MKEVITISRSSKINTGQTSVDEYLKNICIFAIKKTVSRYVQ